MYPCNDCDMEFSTKSYASIHHQKVHQGINYNCDLCDKKFTQKGGLRFYKNTVHGNMPKDWKCEFCEASFYTKTFLLKHKCMREKAQINDN